MNINRVKNTKRNVSWGMLEKIINIIFQFLIRTITIKILGEEFLGLSSLFTSILQVVNMAELGYSNDIAYKLYKPIAENDLKTICALMNAYKKIYRIIGILVISIGIIIMPFVPNIINGGIPRGYNINILYLIYLINSGVSYYLFAYKNCLLEAYQRNDIISKIKVILLIAQTLYQLIVIFIFKNYYLFIIVLPIMTIINNLINAIIVNKNFPNFVCKGKLNKDLKRRIKYDVTGLAIGKICIISRNSLDNIFLSIFLNLSIVAIYNNYYYILTALNTFLAVITSSMSAGVGNSIAIENIDKNYKNYINFNNIYMWISGVCSILLFNLYQPFMRIWMGDNLLFPTFTVLLMCIYFYSLKLGDIRSIYSNASGLFWESKNYVIIEVILNGILNYILGKMFGVNGIIIATNITIIFINFLFGSRILFKHYFKNKKYYHFIFKNFLFGLITFINGYISYNICNIINDKFSLNNFYQFIFNFIICIIISNIIYLIIFYKTKEFKEGIMFIKKIIK